MAMAMAMAMAVAVAVAMAVAMAAVGARSMLAIRKVFALDHVNGVASHMERRLGFSTTLMSAPRREMHGESGARGVGLQRNDMQGLPSC